MLMPHAPCFTASADCMCGRRVGSMVLYFSPRLGWVHCSVDLLGITGLQFPFGVAAEF